ncbi:hypothetical protein ACSQ67_014583 [Phaseolus vulgaris]
MFSRLIHPHEGGVAQEDMQAASNHAHLGDPCLVLTSDPKPRLRWTADLHERFVDAVTQLGGASSQKLFRIVGIRAEVLFVVYGGQEFGSRERMGLSYLSCNDICWDCRFG